MNKKFFNANCAQMAAVSMWMMFVSLNLQCKMQNHRNASFIDVTVFLDAGAKVKIPKGYCYSSKQITHYKEDVTTPAFDTIRFTFEY